MFSGNRGGGGLARVLLLGIVIGGLVIGGFFAFGMFGADATDGAAVSQRQSAEGPDEKGNAVQQPEDPARRYTIRLGEGASLDVGSQEFWVLIDKSAAKLYALKGKEPQDSYPVALGERSGDKRRVGDMRTPEGVFSVQQIQDSSYWKHDFGDGKGPIEGAYGPWFIRLETGWKGIGIHGTHDPSTIGKRVTEGCIRLHNRNIEVLKEQVGIGTTVVIQR